MLARDALSRSGLISCGNQLIVIEDIPHPHGIACQTFLKEARADYCPPSVVGAGGCSIEQPVTQ